MAPYMKEEEASNSYLNSCKSLIAKLTTYEEGSYDFMGDDRLGVLAGLVDEMQQTGHIDAPKLVESWIGQAAQNLMLLHFW